MSRAAVSDQGTRHEGAALVSRRQHSTDASATPLVMTWRHRKTGHVIFARLIPPAWIATPTTYGRHTSDVAFTLVNERRGANVYLAPIAGGSRAQGHGSKSLDN